MKEFSSTSFFDLSSYQHAPLFDPTVPVWNALTQIATYLSSLKLGTIEIDIPNGAFLIDPHLISIGKGSVVEPGAYIQGPCVIGENCVIRHGAYVRGNLIAGDHCLIGHDTEVKNAIFLDHAYAAHFAYLGDSILGNRVNLGAGTKCANLKFNKKNIIVEFQGKKIDTGLRKFGAILGDDVQTGCNVVTNPGTLCGKRAICYAGISVNGIIPPDSIVKNNVQQIIEPHSAKGSARN